MFRIRIVAVSIALVSFVVLLPAAAGAVSLRDIVELTRAGLDDDVIVALVETDRTIYGLDARKLIDLRKEGVSERVLVALLRNGREVEPVVPEAPPPTVNDVEPAPVGVQPAPQVIVIDHQQPAPPSGFFPYYVQVPLFMPAPRGPRHAVVSQPYLSNTEGGFGRFINDGYRPAVGPPSPTPGQFGRFLNDGSRPPDR